MYTNVGQTENLMKYSTDDILSQTFETRFRGYDSDQVHEFLYGLSRAWDEMTRQLKDLNETSETQGAEIREFRQRERALQDALAMARQVSEDVKTSAKRDADLLIANAELQAERLVSQAEIDVRNTKETLNRLKQQRVRFEAELRRTIETHSKILSLYAEGEADLEDEDEENNWKEENVSLQ